MFQPDSTFDPIVTYCYDSILGIAEYCILIQHLNSLNASSTSTSHTNLLYYFATNQCSIICDTCSSLQRILLAPMYTIRIVNYHYFKKATLSGLISWKIRGLNTNIILCTGRDLSRPHDVIFLNCELFNIPPAGESMTMHGMWVDKYNECHSLQLRSFVRRT